VRACVRAVRYREWMLVGRPGRSPRLVSSEEERQEAVRCLRVWAKEEEAVTNGSCDGGSGRQRQQLLLLTAAAASITETAEVDQGQTNCNSDRDKQQQANVTSCVRPEACGRDQLTVLLLLLHCKHGRPSSYVALFVVVLCACVCVCDRV
jgi:hypothetical protein